MSPRKPDSVPQFISGHRYYWFFRETEYGLPHYVSLVSAPILLACLIGRTLQCCVSHKLGNLSEAPLSFGSFSSTSHGSCDSHRSPLCLTSALLCFNKNLCGFPSKHCNLLPKSEIERGRYASQTPRKKQKCDISVKVSLS